jgi:hypothetical protein
MAKSPAQAASVLRPMRWSGHEHRLTMVTGVSAGMPAASRSRDHRFTCSTPM